MNKLTIFRLRFDELVIRARVQDKIQKEVTMERAKGLIAMIVQRREYVKSLKKAKLCKRGISVQRKLTTVPPPMPINKSDNSDPIIQLRKTVGKSLSKINNEDEIQRKDHSDERGKIILCIYIASVSNYQKLITLY